MIKIICHTNLDDYKGERWPLTMYNPKVGDSVRSLNGKILKIVEITHCEDINHRIFLKIELHK